MLRLLLSLLISCLALPAVAAETCPPPAASQAIGAHGHHGAPTEDPAPVQSIKHSCIGCIPLSHPVAPMGETAAVPSGPAFEVDVPSLALARDDEPVPPPPRFA